MPSYALRLTLLQVKLPFQEVRQSGQQVDTAIATVVRFEPKVETAFQLLAVASRAMEDRRQQPSLQNALVYSPVLDRPLRDWANQSDVRIKHFSVLDGVAAVNIRETVVNGSIGHVVISTPDGGVQVLSQRLKQYPKRAGCGNGKVGEGYIGCVPRCGVFCKRRKMMRGSTHDLTARSGSIRQVCRPPAVCMARFCLCGPQWMYFKRETGVLA